MLDEFKDKICLVTGGGGSIGSEIARNLARLGAKQIIASDISENGLHSLITETDGITAEIASIRDYDKMEYIFSAYRPHIVFHAAAHKHVSFMEDNAEEAVKNNIRGTQITADLAEKYGAQKFVLISTDKAVEPVSVMGASKRVCEMILACKAENSRTLFSTVRFGNVIGSSGSVIPLFEKQIKKGLVTVTDVDVTRYFMEITRAAEIVCAAAVKMKGGEIFVPDMGESVKILDLAKKMIHDSGIAAEIKITTLRKGDKLHEKLFYDFESPQPCGDKLFCVNASSIGGLGEYIEKLYEFAKNCDRDGIYDLLMKITDKALIGK